MSVTANAAAPHTLITPGPKFGGMSIRAARKDLARHGVHLCFLPTYSPEFNAMEPVFRQIKYQEMPRRSYTTRTGLREAIVDPGFETTR